MLFIRFDDIFDMLHMNALSPSLFRLMALSMEHQILRENTPNTSVIDPFYMLDGWLQSPGGRRRATEFLESCFLKNDKKDTFLLPYFPE